MKKTVLFLIILLNSLFIYSQDEKVFTLREVDVAPQLYNFKTIDTISNKKNFQNNLMKFIAMNVSVITGPDQTNKVYVQFLIDKNGYVKILQSKSPSIKARLLGEKVIEDIERMEPAKINGEDVSMKITVPITFHTVNVNAQ